MWPRVVRSACGCQDLLPSEPQDLLSLGREHVFRQLQHYSTDLRRFGEVKNLCRRMDIFLSNVDRRPKTHENLCADLLSRIPNLRVDLGAILVDGLEPARKRLRHATLSRPDKNRRNPVLLEVCPGLLLDFAAALNVSLSTIKNRSKTADELRSDIFQRLELLDSMPVASRRRFCALSAMPKDGDDSLCQLMTKHRLETKAGRGKSRKSFTKAEMAAKILEHEMHLKERNPQDPYVQWMEAREQYLRTLPIGGPELSLQFIASALHLPATSE